MSQTSWITCYTLNPLNGGRIKYKLTIIDTPGYGSVRGKKADKRITEQIQTLFAEEGRKGIQTLDAICFVVKAPDVRLTETQNYIFQSILSIFGKDTKENFCMLITFSDGKPPLVLEALKTVELPTTNYFMFNNSAIFARNTEGEKGVERTKIDWDMGNREFIKFFEELEGLSPISIVLSKEVLQERKRLEITVENIKRELQMTLSLAEALRKEIALFKDNQRITEQNQPYTYTTTEIQHVTKVSTRQNLNCTICHNTCHEKCWAFDYTFFKSRCDAMWKGKCTQCKEKCPAEVHSLEKRLHSFKIVNVEKTYEERKKAYEEASKNQLSNKELIAEMENESERHKLEIIDMIQTIITSTKRLQEIALRQYPLSIPYLIDNLIGQETSTCKEGWRERVDYLEALKDQAIQWQESEAVDKTESY